MSEAAAPASDTILTAEAPATAETPAVVSAPAAEAATLLTTDPATTTEAPKTEGTEAKADDAKTAEQKKDEAKTGAPEEYADFKLPDNFKANESTLTEFKAVAKDLGLTQEAAQKLVDFQTAQSAKTVQAFSDEMQSHVDKTAKEWATAAKADKEYGGEEFDKNMGFASAALKAFGTPELKTLLNESRLGNNPEVVRFMVRAGKAISQDGFIPGRASSAAKDAASVLYGSTASK